MRYKNIGSSDLKVSEIGLGTMTFGEQNTEQEAHQQLNLALQYGVNFIDTAEMYSIPPKKETYGSTETIIGNWFRLNGNRDKVTLASKVIGHADWLPHIRNGTAQLNRTNIQLALENSLKRLQTDYLDLYQVHWPDRKTNFFGKLGYECTECNDYSSIEETLFTLDELIKSGKVRYIGISNETPWGVMQYLRKSEQHNKARIISIQNPYNLLNRSFEIGLAEMSHRENIGLLAYSPLAFGCLSGKYLNQQPANARLTLFSNYKRYSNPAGIAATRAYVELAKKQGISAAQMALAFVNSRPFMASTIIGATNLIQLKENLESTAVVLSEELLEEIEAIHQCFSNPCP